MRKMRREPTSLATFLKEDYLEPLCISKHTLSGDLNISETLLEKILEEEALIDTALDQRLSQRFHVHEGFFLSIQDQHQAWKESIKTPPHSTKESL
ncbi:MAG: hypothetical protein PHX65_04820 [Sulfurimonas sp.]|nr:hypothetical protein [Sulfurimonas sp.]